MTRIIPLVLLLLTASSAPSQPSDDTLIEPGRRIGKLTLTMTVNDLLHTHGPAIPTQYVAGLPPVADAANHFTLFYWQSLGIGAITFDRRRIESLVVFFSASSPDYRTERGIGREATRARVLKAYGEPTRENIQRLGEVRLIYDSSGIAFGFDGQRLDSVSVFRSGSAGRLWHFSRTEGRERDSLVRLERPTAEFFLSIDGG